MSKITEAQVEKIKSYVRAIPDFPEPGIIFRDVTTVIKDPEGFRLAIDGMLTLIEDIDFDVVVAAEARGFVFGGPIAYERGKSLELARKKGKLPAETISETYDLEYGTATLELHKDAINPGDRVIIVDDLIATGGTVEATAKMVERLGGEVAGFVFLMELKGLEGRKRLSKYNVMSVIAYEGK